MATLRANGEKLFELTATKFFTDGAEGDPMTKEHKVTFRAMSSGYVLKKTDVKTNYGFGGDAKLYAGTWKRHAKIKKELMGDQSALFAAMQRWADQLIAKGWDAEIA